MIHKGQWQKLGEGVELQAEYYYELIGLTHSTLLKPSGYNEQCCLRLIRPSSESFIQVFFAQCTESMLMVQQPYIPREVLDSSTG